MKRIILIGSCGAGKSTLAKQIHSLTGLELIHLDQLYWKPNWEEPAKKEWEQIVKSIVNKNSWIIDGNYSGTMDIRIARADTIIFLDINRWICLYRVLKRIFSQYGKVRSDVGNDCPERFDWDFLRYVFYFPVKKRPKILEKLQKLDKNKRVISLRSTKAVSAFLEDFKVK